MDFAADAVMDAVAPPPRTSGAQSAPADADAPSFDDHLAAATQDDARAGAAPPSQDGEAQAGEESVETTGEKTDASFAPPMVTQPVPQPEHPSLPLLVQFIASDAAPPQAAAAPAQPIEAPTPAPLAPQSMAPEAAAPAQPMAAAPETPPQSAPSAQAKTETTSTPTSPQSDAAPVVTAQHQPNAAPTATPAAAPTATPAAPVVTATPSSSTGTPTPAVAPIVTAATRADVTREAPAPRSGKSNTAESEEKFEIAPRDARPAPAPASGAKQPSAKTAAAAAPAKEIATMAPAPEPATAQSSAASTPATAQSAAQTQHAALDQSAMRAPAGYQVGREIIRRFDGDSTRFELRLDPPELGRVEVKLEVSRDHRVTAVIAADSPQALTELARHARELEQMLQSAGLELSDSGLSFDLRQGAEDRDTPELGGGARNDANGEAALEQSAPQARPLGYERWRGVRVDVMV